MRRVVVTGLGIVSSIGNNADEVLASLKEGRSGITTNAAMVEHGFRSQIAGAVDLDVTEHVEKRTLRFMGPGAAYAHIAMGQAIADAGLEPGEVVNPMTGLIAGSGGPSTSAMLAAHQVVLNTGATKRIGPFAVPKCMSSTVSANLATAYQIKGMNFSITSACSTSLHCIGMAAQQIALGTQDVMFAGGGEELDWTLSCLFDAMGAMSSKYNDTPTKASRAFDAGRDGFVISGGGAILVLESLNPERKVSYINAHGTSTPVGDVGEVQAVRRVFGEGTTPPISSTKSMTGHSQGATGAQEAIYCLLALQNDFIIPSINVETLDPALNPAEIATTRVDNAGLDTVMTNSFGFGGTNGSMLLSRFDG